jgi:hypothetical protein
MNKKMIEKMFDEKFSLIWEGMPIISENWEIYELQDIKQFIFDTIIPEILKSVLLDKREENNHIDLAYNNYWKHIKNKAKELYWIDL